jgi:hypothetical protein
LYSNIKPAEVPTENYWGKEKELKKYLTSAKFWKNC